MMTFDAPWILVLAAALTAGFLVARIAGRGSRKGVRLPLDPWGGAPSADAPLAWRAALALSSLAIAGAWVAISVAAAGPVVVERSPVPLRAELDIMFVVDVSPSMAAMDLEPTRLDAALALIRDYMSDGQGASGASVGLAAFGAEASLICPPTRDYAVIEEILAGIRPGMLGDGTAVGQGLALALRHLLAGSGSRKAAVLLTDGEDNAGLVHPLEAAASFPRYGAGLVVIGLGSSGDAPIEYVDPATGQRLSGSYRSGFDDSTLVSLAQAADGEYAAARDGASLGRSLAAVGKIAGVDAKLQELPMVNRESFARRFAALALALAGLAWAVRRLILGGVA